MSDRRTLLQLPNLAGLKMQFSPKISAGSNSSRRGLLMFRHSTRKAKCDSNRHIKWSQINDHGILPSASIKDPGCLYSAKLPHYFNPWTLEDNGISQPWKSPSCTSCLEIGNMGCHDSWKVRSYYPYGSQLFFQ